MIENPVSGFAPLVVARIQNAIHNITPELRLDAANGFDKILWITKGNGRVMRGGATQGFGPHTLIFIPGDLPHSVSLGHNTTGIAIALAPDNGVQLPPRTLCHAIDGLAEQSRFTHHFDTILQEYLSDELGSGRAVLSYLSLLSVHIQRSTPPVAPVKKTTAADRLMTGFATLVETHFNAGVSVSDIAQSLGVTPTHLTRVCQSQNRISASQYLQNRVLSEARHMLLFTDQKIQDISDALGITSPAYFSRLFTEKTGVTPKSFRKNRDNARRNLPKPVHFTHLQRAS